MSVTLPQTSEPLGIWERIELVVGEDDSSSRYVVRIEDFISQGLIVSTPEFITGNSRLREGCQVRGFVTRRDAVYQFYSKIKKFTIKGKQLYLLTTPQAIRRVQRRQFVRVDIAKNITIAVISDPTGDIIKFENFEWVAARTNNISGGGFLIQTDQELTKGTILLTKSTFFLEIGLPVTIAAICRREDNSTDHEQYGIEFIRSENLKTFMHLKFVKQLPESIQFFDLSAQNKLVNFIFAQQIEMRKKGLI